jgi:hypothetical protein
MEAMAEMGAREPDAATPLQGGCAPARRSPEYRVIEFAGIENQVIALGVQADEKGCGCRCPATGSSNR